MTSEEIEKLSLKEAREALKSIYASPYCDIYFSLKSQISRLSKEIENAEIDFLEDTAPFKNLITWGEKSLTLVNNLDSILAKIDSKILAEEEKKRLDAPEGTLESYIKKA